jgi:hypothetical protein
VDAGTLARFERMYIPEPNTGCWFWVGGVCPGGYACLRVGSRTDGSRRGARGHVLSFEHYHGPVPTGMEVCHRCDQPSCVNPDHLFAASHRDNMRDAARKKRLGRARGLRNGAYTRPERRPRTRGTRSGVAKLNDAVVTEMRALRAAGVHLRNLSAKFGVSESSVSRICRGLQWLGPVEP